MRAFSNVDCLNLWEAGGGLHPLDQGLLVLSAALPGTSGAVLPDWPLGRRNAALAELRCASFGSRLQGWTACQRCGEKLEVEVDGRLLAGEGADPTLPAAESIVVKGQAFRLPTSRDLARAVREGDAALAARRLLETCCLETRGTTVWSDAELEEIGDRLAAADPQAETRLALRCPACDNEWEETLDLINFLWREIEARARRVLGEIHTLASAYGWSEAEIMGLSERRRALYLELVRA